MGSSILLKSHYFVSVFWQHVNYFLKTQSKPDLYQIKNNYLATLYFNSNKINMFVNPLIYIKKNSIANQDHSTFFLLCI